MTDGYVRIDIDARRRRAAELAAAFGPVPRDLPRDREKAELLRRLGTDERLVGPVRPQDARP